MRSTGPGMTQDGLNRLLDALAEDRERAAELYLHLQNKLIRYFRWHNCPHAEALADNVLDRVARRLAEGEVVERPVSYILGVARRVLLEQKPSPITQLLDGDEPPDALRAPEVADVALRCLDQCLEQLPPESRALLLEYYSAEASARIRIRQQMADRLGIGINALRNRTLRLRQNLEACLQACLKPQEGRPHE